MVVVFLLTLNMYVIDSIGSRSDDGYTDLTVDEVWDLLTDTSDGIQIPVDVRTNAEWRGERIDTPFPEDPRHFTLSKLETEEGLREFISTYNGSEIIFYCKSGGRSSAAAYILSQSNFSGKIYNMVGGITQWKASGYPTKIGNNPPSKPSTPSGPNVCNVNVLYNFSIQISDPDGDAVRAGWDWNNDDMVEEWSSFHSSGEVVEVSHKWSSGGEYYIKVLVEDRVGDRSIFSDPLVVTVNLPPTDLDVDGPTSGRINIDYNYTVSAVDPDGDDIYYYVDWGDGTDTGWVGPYKSSEIVVFSHSWSARGFYSVKVKAKDIYDAESNWVTERVSMPCISLRSFLLHVLWEVKWLCCR